MLTYSLMSTFRQAVIHAKTQPTLTTLHQQVLAVGAFWYCDPKQNQFCLLSRDSEDPDLRGYGRADHQPLLPIQAKTANGLSGVIDNNIPITCHLLAPL